MTLVELMVVVMIIGLLAVTVLPVLNRNPEARRIREAADIVASHLNRQVATALGSANGAATWYAAEPAASGAGNGLAVINLLSGRPRVALSGSARVQPNGVMTLTPGWSSGVTLPAPIQFAGIPAEFTALTATQLWVSGTTAEDALMNRTPLNVAMPLSGTSAAAPPTLPYTLLQPPRPRMQVTAPLLQNNTCIDLGGSTLGVKGFSANVVSLADSDALSVQFDASGRPIAAWRRVLASGVWKRSLLTASTPVALLVGLRSQAGAAVVAVPNADDPGANWQRSDARWVVIDPRSAAVRIVDNFPAATAEDAQAYVCRSLQGF